MSNIALALKSEIARVARKEVRSEIESLRRFSVQHRHAIAQLKRDVAELQKAFKQSQRRSQAAHRSAGKAPAIHKVAATEVIDDGTPRRFSAARLAAHRTRLGLSAADYGKLVGVSGATIFNWEQGKGRPMPEQIQALGLLKLFSPTAALARLAGAKVAE